MFKTLLVEDSVPFRQTTRDLLLERFPFMRVTEAGDGDVAMEEVRCNCPDLVLMDIRLPAKNGLELTREIKSLFPHVIVVILTNYDSPEYRQAADEYGTDYFLVKGTATADEVLTLVASLLSKAGTD